MTRSETRRVTSILLTFLLGVQCSFFQNGDRNILATAHTQEASLLHDYAISPYSGISSIIRSVPNCFLISALLYSSLVKCGF
jgi:hypothetical protein